PFIPSMASMKAAATLRRVDRIGRVSGAASRNAFSRGSEVRHRRLSVVRLVLGGLALLGMAGGAAAQTGRVGGVVKDDAGQPIKGATVLAENPSASPRSFTATTDDKGRFSIIGLRSGEWLFTAQAPGFTPEAGRLRITTIGAP